MRMDAYYTLLGQLDKNSEPHVTLLMRGGIPLEGVARNPWYRDGKLMHCNASWFCLNNCGPIGIGGIMLPCDIIIDIDAIVAVIPMSKG